jgi:hypothetical protein
MRKALALALLALAGAAALLPLSATAARSHTVDATLVGVRVAAQGGYDIAADRVTEKTLGEGAALLRTKSTGGNNLAIRFKVFFPSGMQKGIGTLAFTPQPDGTITFAGTAHFTGGTGRFKGITGNLKLSGTVANGLTTSHVTGNARF